MNSNKKEALAKLKTNFEKEPVRLGIDEAGRGPVLGPMVYACCYWAITNEDIIKNHFKFADSKVLKEEKREQIYEEMNTYKDNLLKFQARVISPEELSNKMLMRNKVSLNKISTDAACELIRNALKEGVNVTEVYVDTVGNPGKYEELLRKQFSNEIIFTVTAKADSLFPVVSAASIVAKVTRDRVVSKWVYRENTDDLTNPIFDNKVGSGYPADPYTKSWLNKNCEDVFGFPSIVRFSWKTTANLFKSSKTMKKVDGEGFEDEGKTRKVFKGDEDDDEDYDNHTDKNFIKNFIKNNNSSAAPKEFNFFSNNNLTLTNFKI
jgi:ribonuclease H2 subunit A